MSQKNEQSQEQSNSKSAVLGLQHLLAMYSGSILVPIMIAGALNYSATQLTYLISADISLSYNQSSFQSNTRGTTSIAGVINVGGNMIVESEGDVRFVNQKITVGDNIIINAKNFEALAGENTYTNTTKSNSTTNTTAIKKLPAAGLNNIIILVIGIVIIAAIIFKFKSRKIKY